MPNLKRMSDGKWALTQAEFNLNRRGDGKVEQKPINDMRFDTRAEAQVGNLKQRRLERREREERHPSDGVIDEGKVTS